MARLLLIDTNTQGEMVREVECNDLQDYYKALNCECFDIAHRKVGDRYYDIFVDDIGLFAEFPIVSAVEVETMEPMLVGNLIFANHDAEGNTTSLTDEDIEMIKSQLLVGVIHNAVTGEVKRQVVVQCEY